VPVAGSILLSRARRATAWKSAPGDAQIAAMGLNEHRDALTAAEQRVESIKVSL
jgi:hypothetical protein